MKEEEETKLINSLFKKFQKYNKIKVSISKTEVKELIDFLIDNEKKPI